MAESDRRDDPEVVRAAQAGDPDAFTALFQRWFDPCAEVARRIVHDEEVAAEVAQDTFLVAWRRLDTLQDPSSFGGWVLRTARNKALNRLDRERRSVAVDHDRHPALVGLEAGDDVAAELDAVEQQRLLWAASAALGERDASVLDLHLRHGLSAGELAEELGVTANNAHQLVFRMKGRLATAIRAWVLYRGGHPACSELGRALNASGIGSFTAEAVKVVDRHASACEECGRRRSALVAPDAMFAAVPALPVAGALRERAAASLRAEGVPLRSDAASGPSGGDAAPSTSTSTSASALGPSAGATPASPTHRVARRRAVLAVAAVAVVAFLVVLGVVVAVGDDSAEQADAEQGTTTDGPAAPPAGADPSLAPPPAGTEAPAPTTTPSVPSPAAPLAPSAPSAPTGPTGPPAPPPGPEVVSFTATPAAGPAAFCGPARWPFTLAWQTTGADGVAMTPAGPGADTVEGGPGGSARGCAPTAGSTWTLTATGPGGTVTATASGSVPDPPVGGPGGLRG